MITCDAGVVILFHLLVLFYWSLCRSSHPGSSVSGGDSIDSSSSMSANK